MAWTLVKYPKNATTPLLTAAFLVVSRVTTPLMTAALRVVSRVTTPLLVLTSWPAMAVFVARLLARLLKLVCRLVTPLTVTAMELVAAMVVIEVRAENFTAAAAMPRPTHTVRKTIGENLFFIRDQKLWSRPPRQRSRCLRTQSQRRPGPEMDNRWGRSGGRVRSRLTIRPRNRRRPRGLQKRNWSRCRNSPGRARRRF